MRLRAVWLAVAVALAVVGSAWGWTRFVVAPELWAAAGVGACVVVAVGLALRLVPGIPPLVAWLAQLVAAYAWLRYDPFEPRGALDPLTTIDVARQQFQHGHAPLAWSLPVVTVFVGLTLLFTLLIELLIHVARAPEWTIVPLAGWFVVYAVIPVPEAHPLSLLAACGGYLGILLAVTLGGLGSWRRGRVTGLPPNRGYAQVLRLGAVMAVGALVLGLAAGYLIPASTQHRPRVSGSSLQVQDPRIDLRSNLHAPADGAVLTYRTTGNVGLHLRLASLGVLDSNGWSMDPMPATALPPADAPLPAPVGLTQKAQGVRVTDVSTLAAPREFLPAPFAPQHVTVAGAWGYDPATATLYALDADRSSSTQQLSYRVESVDILPTREQLLNAPAGHVTDGTDRLPAALPSSLVQVTDAITSNAHTAQEKASAIQDYLRSDRFHYDLSVPPPDQGGMAGIAQFVTITRTGYCEHFAAAMAVMARIAGIPSRVAIGFTPGVQQADGSWLVSNKHMHAWTELYFEGWGWLRFDPTPSGVSGAAPDYTLGTQAASVTPTATPSAASASSTPLPVPSIAAAAPSAAPGTDATSRRGLTWAQVWPILAVVGGALAVLALLAAPGGLRALRRRRRFRPGDDARERTLAAWAEVRDTAVDLKLGWPPETPRQLGARLARFVPQGDRAAATALAESVERARYAPRFTAAGDPAEPARRVRAGLMATAPRLRRWGATVLPRSWWARR